VSFFKKFVSVVSDIVEATNHDTKIAYVLLKDIRDFADTYQITELEFDEDEDWDKFDRDDDWENYDKKLLRIKKLDLSNKGLIEIPTSFMLFLWESNIETLILRSNDIKEISSTYSFEKCSSLKELDLSHNKITKLPEDFETNWSLKKLDLSHNKISELTFARNFNRQLKTLILSNNKFEGCFHFEFTRLSNLKELDLSYNQLKDFNVRDEVGELRILKINNNKITEKLHPGLKKVFEHDDSSFDNNPIYQNHDPYKDASRYKRKVYTNHCFKCRSGIHSDENKQCKTCNFYICGNCGSCFCNA